MTPYRSPPPARAPAATFWRVLVAVVFRSLRLRVAQRCARLVARRARLLECTHSIWGVYADDTVRCAAPDCPSNTLRPGPGQSVLR